MNVITQFRADLYRLIKQTWPEVSGPVFRQTQIERRNWVNAIQENTLVPPWVVVEIPPPAQATDWGVAAPVWKLMPVIYYIASQSDGAGNLGDALENKMAALSDSLLFGWKYTLSDAPTVDVSSTNPVNSSMLDAELPFLSGSLSFGALAGFIPS